VSAPRVSVAAKRRTPWWCRTQMNRLLRCVPPDCRGEVREVLEALDPNPVAAFLYLIREFKVETLQRARALKENAK
jgi:hypothetical protein